MVVERYPCYVRVRGSDESEGLVEVPTESNGTMMLSTVVGQFPKAIGLRFKSAAGAWRGVALNEESLFQIPLDGWGNVEYTVVRPRRAPKRKKIENEGPTDKLSKMTDEEILTDLIMRNLPYSASSADIRKYFEKFGELDFCEVKVDDNKKSRGFGFIRFKTVEGVKKALAATHVIHNRSVEIRYPKVDAQEDTVPTKVFIGRLPRGTTVEELKALFIEFGSIKDVYIPQPFKGFGFVTFDSQTVAEEVMNSTHVLKGTYVNVSEPSKKDFPPGQGNQGFMGMGGNQGNMGMGGNNMNRNMQGNMNNMQGYRPSSVGPLGSYGFGGGFGGAGNYSQFGSQRGPGGFFR